MKFFEPSPLHELISAGSDLAINLLLLGLVLWMYRTKRLQRIWDQITSLSVFGVSIEKETAREAENLSTGEDLEGAEELAAADTRPLVVWATSGRRPHKTIEYLRGIGFDLRELDPITEREAITNALAGAATPIVVTNLKHGPYYNGGQDLAEHIRETMPKTHIVVFTSETAKTRRGAHIRDGIGTTEIATNGPEMGALLQHLVV